MEDLALSGVKDLLEKELVQVESLQGSRGLVTC